MDTPVPTKPLIGLTCRWDEEQRRFYLPAEYAEAIAAAGGIPVLIPLIPEAARELATLLDAFVLTGSNSDIDPERYRRTRGPEVTRVHPQRDETDFQVLDQAFAEKKPVLGICFGMQSLNVYLGGSLVQDIPSAVANAVAHDREAYHPVTIEPGSRIDSWADGAVRLDVNSWHHQSVEQMGKGLKVAGRSPDGVIEAVEGCEPDHFVIAVQWHPERIWRKEGLSARLFAELIKAASAARERKAVAGTD
jgi:putative glutamine amidotransferase